MKIVGSAKTDIPPIRFAEPVQLIQAFDFGGVEHFVGAYVLNDHGDWGFVVRTRAQMTEVFIAERRQKTLD